MIHYKFEGCSETRQANIQFDVDNKIIAERILNHLFGEGKSPCTLDFIKEEDGIYVFKRSWANNHIYTKKETKPLKRKRRWKERPSRKYVKRPSVYVRKLI